MKSDTGGALGLAGLLGRAAGLLPGGGLGFFCHFSFWTSTCATYTHHTRRMLQQTSSQ